MIQGEGSRDLDGAPRVLDLFSGIGGFALAFEAAGFETAAFAEIEPYPCKVLAQHWPQVPNLGDVRGINGEDYRGAVDVICGGFPCQDISTAGKGAGIHGERSGLWFEMLRIIRGARPAFCLLENVPALKSRGADDVLGGLEEAGYTCRAFVVGAVHAGAPHRRQRAWIVAYANSRGTERIDGELLGSAGEGESQGAEWQRVRGEIGYGGADVADADHPGQSADRREGQARDHLGRGGEDLAHAGREGLEEWSGPAGQRPRAATPGGGWWATEPALGGIVDGISGGLDRNEGEINAENSRACFAEAMRHLQDTDGPEALQWATRGLGCMEAEAVLFAFLREYEAGGRIPRGLLEGEATPENILRTMRECGKASGAPLGRGSAEQFAREHPDALRFLSRLVASRGPTPWANSLWESAIPRVAHGVPNRAHRIKALGNSIVPAVAYPFAQWIYNALKARSAPPSSEGSSYSENSNNSPAATPSNPLPHPFPQGATP